MLELPEILTLTKEAYLGGSVYYCPACQRL